MVKLVFGKDTYNNFRGRNSKLEACPTCDVVLDLFCHGFPGKMRPKYDLSSTLEGFDVSSLRFKELLDEHCTSAIEYFETGGGYFVLRPKRVVFIDLRDMHPEYMGICATCGRYIAYHALGLSRPRLLAESGPVGPFDLVSSHQEFGPHQQRNFFLFAGDGLIDLMKSSGMKGICEHDCV